MYYWLGMNISNRHSWQHNSSFKNANNLFNPVLIYYYCQCFACLIFDWNIIYSSIINLKKAEQSMKKDSAGKKRTAFSLRTQNCHSLSLN